MEHVTVQGARIPKLGLGTARMTGDECERAASTALKIGYRHFDTAQMYDNEEAVGAAVRASDVPREEVFLTTKIHPDNLEREAAIESTHRSLDRLDLEYIDLLLIHAPRDRVPIAETVDAMNELQKEGVVNYIGVSNFSVDQWETAIEASATPVVTNQVEYHAGKDQSDVVAFAVENDLSVTAYSPLDVGDLLEDKALSDIADRHGKTPAQVALRWLVQQKGVITVPKAADEDHQRQNFAVFDFELSAEEMERIFERRVGLTDRLRSALGL